LKDGITRTKVQQIDNRDYITLENGYRFTSRTYLDLEVDPAILQTNVQETLEQIDMKIEDIQNLRDAVNNA
jgi:hypothetical protein